MVSGPWLLGIFLLSVVGYANRNAINHDAVSYEFLARHYLNGDLALAVSGLWSPLFVWLLAGLLWVIQEPAIASRAAMAISGLVFLAGAESLARLLPTRALRCAMMIVAALFAALASGVQVTPDLLSAGIYAKACAMMLCAGGNVRRSASAGAIFALAYLAKAVLLPIAIVLIIVHHAILGAQRALTPRRALLGASMALVAMALVSLPWIGLLSAKYGYLTLSNVHAHQHAAAGPPGIAEDLATNRLFVIPEQGRQSQFEDETIIPSAQWSPFESTAYFIHYLRHILFRVPRVLEASRASDLLGLGVVLGAILFVWQFARPAEAPRLGLLFPALILPIAAYLPNVATHIRLFFLSAPFIFVCGLGGAYAIGAALEARRLASWLAGTTFAALVVSALSLVLSQSFRTVETEWYGRALVLAPAVRAIGASGPVATAGRERDKHLAIYLSYALNTPYHGTSNVDRADAVLRSCARLIVARQHSEADRAMRAAPELFDLLSNRSVSIARVLEGSELLLYAVASGRESDAMDCRPRPALWKFGLATLG